MLPKVSIIIPIYNAENNLCTCIDSILNQTYNNIEVILINDGSTDNSGIICEEYYKKDNRIKVIHQKNSGPSAARNVGIDAATGEYIQFVDADDYIENKMTEKLMTSVSKDVQLIICGYKSINKDQDNTIVKENICPITGKYEDSKFMLAFGELFANFIINSPCNKLYLAGIIKEYKIYYVNDIDMGEDLLFNLQYLRFCDNIFIINDALYNYVKFDDNTLTGKFKEDFFENQQVLFEKTREFLKDNNCYGGENKDFIELSYTDSVLNCLQNLFHKDSHYTTNMIKEHIENIVYDECVRKNIIYFKSGNIQKRLIGMLIKHNSIMGIYCYFKIKGFLRDKLNPLFRLLKNLNNKKNYI